MSNCSHARSEAAARLAARCLRDGLSEPAIDYDEAIYCNVVGQLPAEANLDRAGLSSPAARILFTVGSHLQRFPRLWVIGARQRHTASWLRAGATRSVSIDVIEPDTGVLGQTLHTLRCVGQPTDRLESWSSTWTEASQLVFPHTSKGGVISIDLAATDSTEWGYIGVMRRLGAVERSKPLLAVFHNTYLPSSDQIGAELAFVATEIGARAVQLPIAPSGLTVVKFGISASAEDQLPDFQSQPTGA